jgi:hypothetical protein
VFVSDVRFSPSNNDKGGPTIVATQPTQLPERLTITEDVLNKLQELARAQNISISEALTQAINISDIVVRKRAEPGTKVLFKRGNDYEQLTLGGK